MLASFLPYRQTNYQTNLTPAEVKQKLDANVITGFSFISEKPYYGTVTDYDFLVRKAYSRLKKQSLAPMLKGNYQIATGRTMVTLTAYPHTAISVLMVIVGFACVVVIALAVVEFFNTWNIGVLLTGTFPFFVMYGIFLLIFNNQSSAAIRFWVHTLNLTEAR